jgi:hypothetical protein
VAEAEQELQTHINEILTKNNMSEWQKRLIYLSLRPQLLLRVYSSCGP